MKVYYAEVFKRTGTSLGLVGDTDLKPVQSLTWEAAVMEAVCCLYDVSAEELKGPSRRRRVAWPRQVALALTYQFGLLSAANVGRIYGERHYSYVYWSRGRVNKVVAGDGVARDEVKLVLCEAKKRRAES